MIPNPVSHIKHQLYLLQLEWYSIHRYLSLIQRLSSEGKRWSLEERQKLTWTKKLILISTIAILIQTLLSLSIAWLLGTIVFDSDILVVIFFLITLYFTSLIYYLILPIPVAIITPIDYFLKRRVVNRARVALAARPDITVIGITGSYGKTTTRDALVTVLREKFSVVATPENKNMPLGLSKLILEQLDKETQILVVEMGAYQRGDIKELCDIAPPDISILTGINEAHLSRFGGIENTIEAKYEIVTNAKDDALVILNAGDRLVRENAPRFTENKDVRWYGGDRSVSQPKEIGITFSNKKYREDGLGMSFDLSVAGEKYQFSVPHLADYITGTVAAVTVVARHLGLAKSEIERGVSKLKRVPHRLEPITSTDGLLIIDDSYNGNPRGVREAIGVLERLPGERKVYLTPGLVEGGEKAEEIHKDIGKQLADVADVVLLIRNGVTPYIESGLKAAKFKGEIIWYDEAVEAHSDLKNILKKGDVIMFQNDWADNSF